MMHASATTNTIAGNRLLLNYSRTTAKHDINEANQKQFNGRNINHVEVMTLSNGHLKHVATIHDSFSNVITALNSNHKRLAQQFSYCYVPLSFDLIVIKVDIPATRNQSETIAS
jgi:hypothetical protein